MVNAFKAFTLCAIDRTNKIVINSVPPRMETNVNGKIIEVNKELQKMCLNDGHTFLDHDPAFHLMNGEINHMFLINDGLHLSQAGIESIIKTC